MIEFVVLALIYMTPDGERYQEAVVKFPDLAACEMAAVALKADLAAKLPGDALVFHTCQRPKTVSSADV